MELDRNIMKAIGEIEYSNFKALTLIRMYKECCDLSDNSFDNNVISEMILDQVQKTEDLLKSYFMDGIVPDRDEEKSTP